MHVYNFEAYQVGFYHRATLVTCLNLEINSFMINDVIDQFTRNSTSKK